jgi:SAM-dependent methyltransferase
MESNPWAELAQEPAPSWYLDPLVAAQKKQLHLALIRDWTRGFSPGTVLKTDLFEEAYGEDQILFELLSDGGPAVGIDVSFATVRKARIRCPGPARFLVTDVRALALGADTVDLIVSNSTLDHFGSKEEFHRALHELARALRPGGLLVVTMDNPLNPLYRLLRWATRSGWGPYPLGYTTSRAGLVRALEAAGLDVLATDRLIHNPRLASTLLFLGLRRLLGARADAAIRGLLHLFAGLERLPSREFTACFVAACGRKRLY